VTLPDTPKFKLACWAGAMVPDAETVCFMVPVVTLTVWVVICKAGAAELLVPSQMPMPAPAATTTTTAATTMFLRLNRRFGAAPVSPSMIGTSSVTSSARTGDAADLGPLTFVPTDSVLTDSVPTVLLVLARSELVTSRRWHPDVPQREPGQEFSPGSSEQPRINLCAGLETWLDLIRHGARWRNGSMSSSRQNASRKASGYSPVLTVKRVP
jgi:hypothetical protein